MEVVYEKASIMDNDDLEYWKNLRLKKREEILEMDNFTNWLLNKNKGNHYESK